MAETGITNTHNIPADWGVVKNNFTALKEFLQRDYRRLKLPSAEVLDFLHLDSSASDPIRVLILHWLLANEYNQALDAEVAQALDPAGARPPHPDRAALERAKAYGEQIIREFPESKTGKQVDHLLKGAVEPMFQNVPNKK